MCQEEVATLHGNDDSRKIVASENKEEVITQIEKIVDGTEEEEKALNQLKEQFATILKQEK